MDNKDGCGLFSIKFALIKSYGGKTISNMKKIIFALFIIVLVFQPVSGFSQSFAKIYNSPTDFFNGICDSSQGIIIERRTRGQIIMNGGNDFKISSEDKVLSKKLKKQVWGVVYNDSLFINGRPLKLGGSWYGYTEIIGKRLFLLAGIPLDKDFQDQMAIASMMGGPLVAGIAGADLALVRYYYEVYLPYGSIAILKKEKMAELLASAPDLAQSYALEEEPEKIPVLKRYLLELKKR